MNKKLLIINRKQFGYHIDTYFYCKHLNTSFEITYICFDHGITKLSVEHVNVRYVERTGLKLIRFAKYLWITNKEIKKTYDVYFIKYFIGCSLLKVVNPGRQFVLDIRTGSVSVKKWKRYFLNALMKFETLFFKNITIISKNLAHDFNLKNAHILPLGSDTISTTNKQLNSFHLLYVGTLEARNIEQTIYGFKKFHQEYKDLLDIQYIIIGSGYKNEEEQLKKLVSELDLTGIVSILGRIPHNELRPHFDSQNIGISYIPITPYFDSQPPTKTFEYILSGMPVIATATTENKCIITPENGVLIDDTPDSFYMGLVTLYTNRAQYNSDVIRSTCEQFTWENIVNKNLKPFLNNINDT